MANRKIYNIMRQTLRLTARQRAIVIGTLLGDGSLIETTSRNNLRLQVVHCAAQKAFVFWKYCELKSFVLTPPTYQKQNRAWRFRTISHPELTALGKKFYQGRHKVVPKEISQYLTPIGLAVWFMDDGACAHQRGLILNTQCFTYGETKRLRAILAKKFKISPISLHFDKSGWRLYIHRSANARFKMIIKPYMLPELMYKVKAL